MDLCSKKQCLGVWHDKLPNGASAWKSLKRHWHKHSSWFSLLTARNTTFKLQEVARRVLLISWLSEWHSSQYWTLVLYFWVRKQYLILTLSNVHLLISSMHRIFEQSLLAWTQVGQIVVRERRCLVVPWQSHSVLCYPRSGRLLWQRPSPPYPVCEKSRYSLLSFLPGKRMRKRVKEEEKSVFFSPLFPSLVNSSLSGMAYFRIE